MINSPDVVPDKFQHSNTVKITKCSILVCGFSGYSLKGLALRTYILFIPSLQCESALILTACYSTVNRVGADATGQLLPIDRACHSGHHVIPDNDSQCSVVALQNGVFPLLIFPNLQLYR